MRPPCLGLLNVLAVAGTLACTPAFAEEVRFNLDVRAGKVVKELQTIRVHQGDAVELHWTSDKTMRVHLHGYDLQVALKPGAETVTAFKANAAGRFSAAELKEGAGHQHGGMMFYLEVYP